MGNRKILVYSYDIIEGHAGDGNLGGVRGARRSSKCFVYARREHHECPCDWRRVSVSIKAENSKFGTDPNNDASIT